MVLEVYMVVVLTLERYIYHRLRWDNPRQIADLNRTDRNTRNQNIDTQQPPQEAEHAASSKIYNRNISTSEPTSTRRN